MNNVTRTATLHARLVGRLWMPGVVAWKDVTARIDRSNAGTFYRGGAYASLRDAMLALVCDGDFRVAGFDPDNTWLTVEERDASGSTVKMRSRTVPIRFATEATNDMQATEALMSDVEYADD